MDDLKLTGYQAEQYFQEQRKRLIKHTKPHQWDKSKRNPWLVYCDECGLIWANNPRTLKAIKHGCTFYRLKPN